MPIPHGIRRAARHHAWLLLAAFALLPSAGSLVATPANRAALDRHYDQFLSRDLNRCTTCHLPSEVKDPQFLDEFPHNPFGQRLRELGRSRTAAGQPADLISRLALVAGEDADGDGVANETELLLGSAPGDVRSRPSEAQLAGLPDRRAAFAGFQRAYRWRPFETPAAPSVPAVRHRRWVRNPVDAFLAAEHEARGLVPRPEAARHVLLRRVYLDLIGLSPTPEEQQRFLRDTRADAYERLVDRLLADPRHGERWARHWMDVWRYSDWAGWADGNQIRDSKPHIWRWRDWIVESLNQGRGYDRMILEMLAADELAPLDTNALRATGFLVRNYKMLSREQWMEDTLKHTSQAFLGVTMGCTKCHDHMADPIPQSDYYRLRAVFEPHDVRTDRLPGQLDTAHDGLVRAYDQAPDRKTYLFIRGDERHPDTNRVAEPGVPVALCGATAPARQGGRLAVQPVTLPRLAAEPDRRDFVARDLLAASEQTRADARRAAAQPPTNATPDQAAELKLAADVAEAKFASLQATLQTERWDRARDAAAWTEAAMLAARRQRELAHAEARLQSHQAQTALRAARQKLELATQAAATNAVARTNTARPDAGTKAEKARDEAGKKSAEAAQALAQAEQRLAKPPDTEFKPRTTESFPATSSGRRLALARWITDPANPLTARVAMNHVWLRHFGRGLVPTPADFGRNGRPPSHPQLLDWLACEFVARRWDMKAMHRLLVTSSAYRMASTPDDANARIDPDNVLLWRMPSRRMEAEVVRDNLLHVAGSLDPARGGPDIDHKLGLVSKRRSLYLRLAAEKEVEFLKIFDGPSVTECYERRPSVIPQQALALANSELALAEARALAARLGPPGVADEEFIRRAFEQVLARPASREEAGLCRDFLRQPGPRPRENLALVLFNHNDFVAIR